MSIITVTIGDIETTGLRQEDGHRIIEVGLCAYAFDTVSRNQRQLSKTWVQRINPGRLIDPGAEAVHGISLADLRGKPSWEDVAPICTKIFSKTNIFIAHNAAFDAPFLALELLRVGQPMPVFNVFCTMEHGRKATSMGKTPNLGELCYATGVLYEPEKAHSAAYDVDVLAQAYWNGVASNLFPPPDKL